MFFKNFCFSNLINCFLIIILFLGCDLFKKPKTQDFTIIHTANIRGRVNPSGCFLEPKGGLKSLESKIKDIKKDNSKVLLFDSGDTLFLNLPTESDSKEVDKSDSMNRAESIVNFLNKMDFTAYTFGETDFFYGYQTWKNLVNKLSLPVLSFNLSDKGKIITPYKILNKFGLKILVFALTGDLEVYNYFKSDVLNIKEYENNLKTLIDAEKPDFVIAMVHGVFFDDSFFNNLKTKIDLILVGHQWLREGVKIYDSYTYSYPGVFGGSINKINIKLIWNKEKKVYDKTITGEEITIDNPELNVKK